jgi:hypothetical protein
MFAYRSCRHTIIKGSLPFFVAGDHIPCEVTVVVRDPVTRDIEDLLAQIVMEEKRVCTYILSSQLCTVTSYSWYCGHILPHNFGDCTRLG